MNPKIFDYSEARSLIPLVREITAAAHARIEQINAELKRAPPGSPGAIKLKEWIDHAVNRWAERIAEIGALPKGIWTVDFDSGADFFFCWSFDEEDLGFYHLHDEGFRGRKPLSGVQKSAGAPALLN